MPDSMNDFLNIWEIDSHFKCPVIGVMLSVEKHRSILKKIGYDVKKMKPYEYHQTIMLKLNNENIVSAKVNNFIRTKAHKYMARIAGMPENEIRSLWKEHMLTGNVGPLLYAIVSCKKSTVGLLSDVFGEVHMQSHANMTGIFQVRQRLTRANENLKREQEKSILGAKKIKTFAATSIADAREIARLQDKNKQMQFRELALENKIKCLKNPHETIHGLEQRIAELERDLESCKESERVMEREKKSLQIDLFGVKSENELLKNEARSLTDCFNACTDPECPKECTCTEESCARYQLCAKRVFMIGGLSKMKSHYKDIIENAGGEFDYHDGYLTNARANLESRVRRSDVVLCPANINSHNACLRVKKICNRHNKKLMILRNSSLFAVTEALFKPTSQTVLN